MAKKIPANVTYQKVSSIRLEPGSPKDWIQVFDLDEERLVVQEVLDGTAYPAPPFDIGEVRTIVDVGAHVGAAALWFLAHCPGATCYCYEPNPLTFKLLKANLKGLDVRLFNYGLWEKDRKGALTPDRNAATACMWKRGWPVATKKGIPVQLRDAQTALAESHIGDIDILKVDTEGAEVQILVKLKELLPKVKLLYVEYHSDSDRLTLDDILDSTHTLFHARATIPHRGTLGYGRNDLVAPTFDKWAI